jgi:antitoxin VapB
VTFHDSIHFLMTSGPSKRNFYRVTESFCQDVAMGAQLNIRSEDAYRLASQLAELTGESLTTAVTEALRERLERQRQTRNRDERLRRLRAITADIRAAMGDDVPSSDHSCLYDDESGLPI